MTQDDTTTGVEGPAEHGRSGADVAQSTAGARVSDRVAAGEQPPSGAPSTDEHQRA